MSILDGYEKLKRYLRTEDGYRLCSQWTSSETVHFDDGGTAQEKLGEIDGITDSLTTADSRIALSAKAGSDLQNGLSEKISKTGGTMTGMLDTVYDSGQVKVFCDNRGGHVWIYNTALKKVLQIVCENDVAEFYLVDISGTPTLLNFFQLDSGTFSTGKNLAIGAGANEDNRRIDFISPKRHIWAGHANSNGNFYLYDTTNNKSILSSTAAGVSTFHGNAASATNADTVDGKHASDLQNYNNLTNKPTIPNSVAVKGNKEGAYRQGNVNLTPANIGAVNTAGDTMAGTLYLNNGTANTPSISWKSTKRTIWAGQTNGEGNFYIWDSTNSKGIFESYTNGNVLMPGGTVTVGSGLLEAKGLRSNGGWLDLLMPGETEPRASLWVQGDGGYNMRGNNRESSLYSYWRRSGGDWYVGVRFVNYGFNAAAVIPYGDGTQHLGGNGARWAQLWASNATITTSDRNYKEEIEYLSDDDAKDIIMHLKPASFRFKNKEGDIITHDRRHFGFIAQDIEDDIVDGLGISSCDLGFFIKSPTKDIPDYDGDLDYIYSLRYEEFISVAVKTIQTQQKEIESQQKKIDDLERRLEMLEKMLAPSTC